MRRVLASMGAAGVALVLVACTPAASQEPDRIVRPSAPTSSTAPTSGPDDGSSTSTQTQAPSSEAAQPGTDALTCVDGAVAIRGSDADVSFSGECDRVQIEGDGLDVDLEDARIGAVVVRGDRIEVELGSVGSLDVTGQSADIDAETIGALTVAGDRNTVEADEIGSVTVSGNDNRVEATRLGASEQSGDRNDIRTR